MEFALAAEAELTTDKARVIEASLNNMISCRFVVVQGFIVVTGDGRGNQSALSVFGFYARAREIVETHHLPLHDDRSSQ